MINYHEIFYNTFMNILPYLGLVLLITILQQMVNKYIKNLKKNKHKQTKITNQNQFNEQIYLEKIQKGKDYEIQVGNHYRNKGYEVYQNGIEKGKLDEGIDIIAENEDERILIQCKNWSTEKSIKQKHIKEFVGSCKLYEEKNNYNDKQIKYIYAIPNKNLLDYGAEQIFIQNYQKYRYEIIPFVLSEENQDNQPTTA